MVFVLLPIVLSFQIIHRLLKDPLAISSQCCRSSVPPLSFFILAPTRSMGCGDLTEVVSSPPLPRIRLANSFPCHTRLGRDHRWEACQNHTQLSCLWPAHPIASRVYVGETGAEWIKKVLYQYHMHPNCWIVPFFCLCDTKCHCLKLYSIVFQISAIDFG